MRGRSVSEQFASEPVEPVGGSLDARAMARGEPGLPARFRWRGGLYRVRAVLEEWKTSTPEGGSGELYLRRHWFSVAAEAVGGTAAPALTSPEGGEPPQRIRCTLYCLRRAPAAQARRRWWLYAWSPEAPATQTRSGE